MLPTSNEEKAKMNEVESSINGNDDSTGFMGSDDMDELPF